MPTFEYAPAPESRSVVDINSSYGLFINGEFVDSAGGTPFKTISPSTEEVLAEVSEASAEDVDRAVAAARTAYRSWSRLSGADRGKYLFRIARIMQERAREFAVLESLDNGKPIKESRDVDIPTAAAHFFYHAGWADKLAYASLGENPRPHGVVGQVIPWNFPLLMLSWKIAPALATGKTVVLKPAETTPLTALLFAEVCQQADLPPGVVNIITGAGETGRALIAHEGVAGVARAGDDVDHAGRQVGLLAHLGEEQRGQRGGLGGFEHHGVAGGQRGSDLPGQHQQGEVPRDHLGGDAERPGAEAGVLQLVGPAGVVEEVRCGDGYVDVARLLDGLAVVERLQHGELAGAFLEDPGDAEEVLRPLSARQFRPHPAVGAPGRTDGVVDVGG